ncbi:MAG: Rrf2 family transcriptional regulator [Desulfuromonadaceae bacterium]|nr:RrF2 family transcriptional regulator [Geobacteraceae bacterium]
MRFSKRSLYAVRAMVRLAIQHKDRPVSIREISEIEDISLPYLEQLFACLRRSELVKSVRGPGGGYVLSRPAAEINLEQIVESVDETIAPAACTDKDSVCLRTADCFMPPVWNELGEKIREFLADISVEDLMARAKRCDLSDS